MKNFLSLLLRFGLSGVLLVYLFSKIDVGQMTEMLKSADFKYIFYAGTIFMVIHVFLLLRWTVFIRALDLHVSFQNIFNCFFIGLFFNLFLPTSTGGDIVKTIFLFKDTNDKPKVVASVVADRLCGFVSICFVALVFFIFAHKLINDRSVLLSILVLAGVSLGLISILFSERIFSFCCRIFPAKIKEKIMSLHYAIALLKGKKSALLTGVVLSCLSQMTLAYAFHLVAKALHHEIPLIYFLTFVPMVCVVASLPSIGGLGVRDAGVAYFFAKVGVATSTSVSISLINFFFMVLMGLLGGAIYVLALSPRRVQHHSSDARTHVEKN